MATEHHVWSVPPGENDPELAAIFKRHRWQWAEKLRRALVDHGHSDVEVVTIEVDNDGE